MPSLFSETYLLRYEHYDGNPEIIDKKENVILIGTPGAGKTHYSIGLGIKACFHGKNVLFVSVPMINLDVKYFSTYYQIEMIRVYNYYYKPYI